MIVFFLKFYMEQLHDYRAEFSQWWTKEMKSVKFPAQGTVFDYYIDPVTKKFLPWNDKVPKFEMEAKTPLQVANSDIHTIFFMVECKLIAVYSTLNLS